MPLYDYMCQSCYYVSEHFFHLRDRPEHTDCECGGLMLPAFLKAPSLHGETGDYERRRFPYFDEPLDTTFYSKKQKDDYLKKHGLRIRERGEKFRGHTKDPLADKLAKKIQIFTSDDKKDLNNQMNEKIKEIKQTRRTHG